MDLDPDVKRQAHQVWVALCDKLAEIEQRQLDQMTESFRDFMDDLINYPLVRPWRESLDQFQTHHWRQDGMHLTADSYNRVARLIEKLVSNPRCYAHGPIQAEAQTAELPSIQGVDVKKASEPNTSSSGKESKTPVSVESKVSNESPSGVALKRDSKAAPRQPYWPKLTEQEIDRIERQAGWRWYYPFVPTGEFEAVWLRQLQDAGSEGRQALLSFWRELAALGRMASGLDEAIELDEAALFAQHDQVQRAFDQYIKKLIAIEVVWKRYLQAVQVMIGVHVIGLKEKIDQALPYHLDGFHSQYDEEYKTALRQSSEAHQVALGRVEFAYTAAVWTDRAIIAAQFILPVAGGAKAAFVLAIRSGATRAAALRVALTYVVARAAITGAEGLFVGEVIPRVLQEFGVDEGEARAGVTVFVSLLTLRGALKRRVPVKPTRVPRQAPRNLILESGRQFDRAQSIDYPYNQLPILKARGSQTGED